MTSEQKKKRSGNLSQKNLRPKLFHRKQDETKGQDLYEEGVEEIIKLRKFLQLTQQTVLIAVDIYKNFLKTIGWQLRQDKVAVYMASIFIASKLNQVFPTKIESLLEGCENLTTRKKILMLEKVIFRSAHFQFPIKQNISFYFAQILGLQKKKKIEICVKQALKCLSDPILIEVDNQTLARAIISILFPEQTKNRKVDKDLVRVIFRLKRKLNVSVISVKL